MRDTHSVSIYALQLYYFNVSHSFNEILLLIISNVKEQFLTLTLLVQNSYTFIPWYAYKILFRSLKKINQMKTVNNIIVHVNHS